MHEVERRLEELGRGILEAERPISLDELGVAQGVTIDVAPPGQRTVARRRPRWRVAAVVGVLTLVAFVPLLLARQSEDEPAASTTPIDQPVPSGDPGSSGPVIEGLGYSSHFPSVPFASGLSATGVWFEVDGAYYGLPGNRVEENWFRSSNGFTWQEFPGIDSAKVPPLEGGMVAFYQLGDQLYATHRGNSGSTPYRILEWVDEGWVDVDVVVPSRPEGVDFIADTDAPVVQGVYPEPHHTSSPTMVVLRDGHPLTVGAPERISSGMVTVGGIIYAISLEDAGYRLWRSSDGFEWEQTEIPQFQDERIVWAYLTGGHDRLMLTVGLRVGEVLTERFWTSTDATTWDELTLPRSFDHPAIPQATDFGWMIISMGRGDEFGHVDPEDLSVLLSLDGVSWVDRSPDFHRRTNFIAADPIPVYYHAGIFTRWNLTGNVEVWRLVED
jgi:hypothetical protein